MNSLGSNLKNLIASLGADLLSSVVVFLVALPLCMGIAIASNMPPSAGLVTGIIGGVIIGVLSGSPLQVSGPAAGLAVLVWQLVEKHGADKLGIVVLFAGVIQFLAGIFKMGQWFRAVSPAVIHGMLAGIGILIFAAQFHVMLDFKPIGTGVQNLLGIPNALFSALHAGDFHLTAGEIGLFTVIIIAAWSSFAPKSWRILPAPLVGVAFAVASAAFFGLEKIKYVEVDANILANLKVPTVSSLLWIFEPSIFLGAVSVAFIASAETLLCATAVDQMHSGVRTKYDKELRAQGIGNALSGALGALPMTGVIVRSGANVEAGAKTRISTILHGVWLLVFVAILPWTLEYVPLSALAAVLVFTGYKLAYPKILPILLKFGRGEVIIYLVTIVTIVLTDLLTGVLIGLGLSIAKLLYSFSHLDIIKVVNKEQNHIDIYLKGAATLIRLPQLATELESLPASTNVQVHIADLDYIDHACIDLLTNWDRQHRASGGTLNIAWEGLSSRYQARTGAGKKAARETAAIKSDS